MQLSGIKFLNDSKGYPKSVVIDLKKHGEDLEDFLDALIIDARKNEPIVPWEEVKKRLNKKHGIK